MTAADPTNTLLRGLSSEAHWRAITLLNTVRRAGYPLIITSAKRDAAEQAELVRRGRSATLNSRHLTGDAFDVDVLGVHRDLVPLWFWNAIGPWAETWLNLTWGGRWRTPRDYGHFEVPRDRRVPPARGPD